VVLLVFSSALQPTNMDNMAPVDNSISDEDDTVTESSNKENDMGNRSQQRKKATRRKKTRPKYIIVDNLSKKNVKAIKQTTLFGCAPPKNAFNRFADCEICKAKAEGRNPPHRGHHYRCELNKEYGHLRLSEQQAARELAEKQRLIELNKKLTIPTHVKKAEKTERERLKAVRAPISHENTFLPLKSKVELEKFLAPRQKQENKVLNKLINPYDKRLKQATTTAVTVDKNTPVEPTKTTTLTNDITTTNTTTTTTNNMASSEKNEVSSLSSNSPTIYAEPPVPDIAVKQEEAHEEESDEELVEVPTAEVLRQYVDAYMAEEKAPSKKCLPFTTYLHYEVYS
jgi:hypothetical protein